MNTKLITKHTDTLQKLIESQKKVYQKIKEIESKVEGTLRNPSDCDMTPARISFGDVKNDLGLDQAQLWQNLRNQQSADSEAASKVFKLLNRARIKAGMEEINCNILY